MVAPVALLLFLSPSYLRPSRRRALVAAFGHRSVRGPPPNSIDRWTRGQATGSWHEPVCPGLERWVQMRWNRSVRRVLGVAGPNTIKTFGSGRVLFATPPSSSLAHEILSADQIDAISRMVSLRAEARLRGDYDLADSIRDNIEALQQPGDSIATAVSAATAVRPLPVGYRVEIRDVPRKLGGGSDWSLVSIQRKLLESSLSGETVLGLAHAALGVATSANEGKIDDDVSELAELVQKAEERLDDRSSCAMELRGRKAADAAFWFALSGVSSTSLFESLAAIATDELRRFGLRPTCRAVDVMHIVERFAASGGTTAGSAAELYCVAADCLLSKDVKDEGLGCLVRSLRDGTFDLHADRPLLWLWRFSARQRKQRSFLRNAVRRWENRKGKGAVPLLEPPSSNKSGSSMENKEVYPASVQEGGHGRYDWSLAFANSTMPLIVDVGCGMGVSILGLASLGECGVARSPDTNATSGHLANGMWSGCNFAGVDLSCLTVGYANGVSQRRGLNGRVRFFADNAERFLKRLGESYPGEVRLVMVQFPTPFRLAAGENEEGVIDDSLQLPSVAVGRRAGNSQLPVSPSSGFMVTETLLQLARSALLSGSSIGQGRLLIQSNCEDVAVYMKNTAGRVGFRPMDAANPVTTDAADLPKKGKIPRRTFDWVAAGGERASGGMWSAVPLIPRRGATETEISCMLNGTPVHRCMLSPIEPMQI